MLHLFSKVYIASDVTIDINFDRVVISDVHGNQLYSALEQVTYGELISYGKTLESVLGGTTFPAFIQALKTKVDTTGKKVIIYADDVNFIKFMSIWLKSIFVDCSSTAAWKIIDSYISKEKAYKNWRYKDTTTEEEIYPLVTETAFTTDYNQATATTISNVQSSLSVEFLLSSYLANGTYKQELKDSISILLERSMQELAIEIKHVFIKNCSRPTFPVLNVSSNFFNNSTLYVEESLGRVSSVFNSVDIKNATQTDIDAFKLAAETIYVQWDQFESTSSIIQRIDLVDLVRSPITDTQLNDLIDFEKTALGTCRFFSSSDEEKINLYFLDYVLFTTNLNLQQYILK